MIYQLLWKKLILEKNRTLNFQLLKNVKLVKDQDQNLAMMLIHVLCVFVFNATRAHTHTYIYIYIGGLGELDREFACAGEAKLCGCVGDVPPQRWACCWGEVFHLAAFFLLIFG